MNIKKKEKLMNNKLQKHLPEQKVKVLGNQYIWVPCCIYLNKKNKSEKYLGYQSIYLNNFSV